VNIVIDPEFQARIPALKPEELEQLEQNILQDGCRDSLVVWPLPTFDVETEDGKTITLQFDEARINYHGDEAYRFWALGDEYEDVFEEEWPRVLIDGHNRHAICTKHGIEFNTIDRSFDSRIDALLWIVKNARGRRNLTDFVLAELALVEKDLIAARARAQQVRKPLDFVRQNSDEQIRTDEELGKAAGVSRDTIRKVEKITQTATPELIGAARAGDLSVHLASQAAELPADVQREIAVAPVPKEAAREAVHNHRAQGTGENEWYTPAEYIEAAREVLGTIDLDPASSDIAQRTIKATRYFTVEDNGLSRTWGGRVWLNPPYAQPAIQQFAEKMRDEVEAGRVEAGIMLTHNYTDTRWFHIAASRASAICFTRGRIGFLSPDGKRAAPTQGQAFFYYGAAPDAFADAFCRFGLVLVVSRLHQEVVEEMEAAA
jgi:phage N-6-adenine-methyltransferase